MFVPFEMNPGKAPRRIVIERKKRLFASFNIEVRGRIHSCTYASECLATSLMHLMPPLVLLFVGTGFTERTKCRLQRV